MTIRARILPINLALVIIGVVDLLTTLIWIGNGQAIEVNPVMAATLKTGLPLFICVKLASLCAYVGVMEWYRRHRNPVFARFVGNFTVLAYLCIYAVSFVSVNHTYFLG